MKYIKTYEGIWSKNIKENQIYKIDSIYIAQKGEHNIPLGKVLDTTDARYTGKEYSEVKTFLRSSLEEYTFIGLEKKFIKRKATPEEINEYYAIENSKKYNL
jgi:hypothetical protein